LKDAQQHVESPADVAGGLHALGVALAVVGSRRARDDGLGGNPRVGPGKWRLGEGRSLEARPDHPADTWASRQRRLGPAILWGCAPHPGWGGGPLNPSGGLIQGLPTLSERGRQAAAVKAPARLFNASSLGGGATPVFGAPLSPNKPAGRALQTGDHAAFPPQVSRSKSRTDCLCEGWASAACPGEGETEMGEGERGARAIPTRVGKTARLGSVPRSGTGDGTGFPSRSEQGKSGDFFLVGLGGRDGGGGAAGEGKTGCGWG